MNATDPSGLCIGGRLCEGEINENTKALKAALQKAGYNGAGMSLDQLLSYAASAISQLESLQGAYTVASFMSESNPLPTLGSVQIGEAIYAFSPPTPEEQRALNALLSTQGMQDRLSNTWASSIETGKEHAFFVWMNNH